MDMKNLYRTRDLAEASFLYASGKKLIGLDNDNGRRWFIFEDKSSCEELTNAFWRRDAMVNAKAFADSFRSLKDLIFNKDENEDKWRSGKCTKAG